MNCVPQAVQLHTHTHTHIQNESEEQEVENRKEETGCQHMFTAEERMMGEDEAGYIYIQLVVCLGVAHSSYVEVHMLGLQSLGRSRQQWKHRVIMQTFSYYALYIFRNSVQNNTSKVDLLLFFQQRIGQ